MGTYIETQIEVKHADGRWYEDLRVYDKLQGDELVLDRRDYNIFGFLGNIRNIAKSPYISDCRGLPTDSMYFFTPTHGFYEETEANRLRNGMNFGFSWVTLQELLAYDYDQWFFDEREQVSTTLRDFLGEYFFAEVERLKPLGKPEDVRLVFWFS